ncbi:YcaO-like family protein [Cognatiyoonia sp. IB215182]|uniref:YcaO-like family protein n=1 Tax=Cognatiyoonia sp. IB215182 TaxID=3097353 RepID=UPI002A1200DF|nr:YcaO-like family protein [Cognatiyoonia sp. IB215182]MDX8355319.1 YcaO-like family protein [Cognatiyoonia sp. IB215182]
MSVFGKGSSLTSALTRLYGEAAERDAILMRLGDTDCAVLGRDLERLGQIPAAHVRMQNEATDLGSTGCAAHTILQAAAENAVCELIERLAIERWWRGQVEIVHLGPSWAEIDGFEAYVAQLRKEAIASRQTEVFSLGAWGPVQTVMARSRELDGGEVAVAFAAGRRLEHTARRAVLELASVELETSELRANRNIDARFERESTLGLIAARQEVLAGSHAALFDACGAPIPADVETPQTVGALLEGLANVDLDIRLVDLTRPETGLPACRAMFLDPSLQPATPKGFELSPL